MFMYFTLYSEYHAFTNLNKHARENFEISEFPKLLFAPYQGSLEVRSTFLMIPLKNIIIF